MQHEPVARRLARSLRPRHATDTKAMMTPIRTFLSLGLALAVSAALTAPVGAAETKPATPALKPVPATLEGKLLAVDKTTKVVTIDIKGTILRVNVTPQVKLARKGKPATLEELAPGQTVSLSFVEKADGHLEVASLTVLSSPNQQVPAGPTSPSVTAPANRDTPTSPFPSSPNPANVGGPVRSPNQ